MVVSDSASASTGATSSSRMVSVRAAGAARPLPPVTVPATCTCLCPVPLSSRAVMVTAPVLTVFPAAMISTLFVLSVKPAGVAGGTAVAATVTVTCSLEGPSSAAVTVLTPPSSPISAGDSVSRTTGVGSSSRTISGTGGGATIPRLLCAVPVTFTVASGASTPLLSETIGTAPVLCVSLAGMVSRRVRVSRAGTAPLSEVRARSTVVGSSEGQSSAAVTVATPPFSEITVGDSASRTGGGSSSSTTTSRGNTGTFPVQLKTSMACRSNTSFGSSISSSKTLTSRRSQLVTSPGRILNATMRLLDMSEEPQCRSSCSKVNGLPDPPARGNDMIRSSCHG